MAEHKNGSVSNETFDDFLAAEGILEACEYHAIKEVIASLARSEAQIATGQTVPVEPVLDRLRASITKMQTDAQQKTDTPKHNRPQS